MAESPRPPSGTAVLTAVARALHRLQPPPVVFVDDLALGLAGVEGSALAKRLVDEMPGDLVVAFCRWVGVRSRYTEDLVEQAVQEGVEQYVVLGAGLDSFAYRRHDLIDHVQVFEVDHPGSQSWKRNRLTELGVTIPGNVVFAPVDFEHGTLRQGLSDVGFDFSRPSVFSWIGVTMYLSLDAIAATLTTIGQSSVGTKVVLTYNQPRELLDDLSLRVTSAFIPIATKMGEPFVSLFSAEQINDLLRGHGFCDISDFGADEARTVYFEGRDNVEMAGAQRVATATVGPASCPAS